MDPKAVNSNGWFKRIPPSLRKPWIGEDSMRFQQKGSARILEGQHVRMSWLRMPGSEWLVGAISHASGIFSISDGSLNHTRTQQLLPVAPGRLQWRILLSGSNESRWLVMTMSLSSTMAPLNHCSYCSSFRSSHVPSSTEKGQPLEFFFLLVAPLFSHHCLQIKSSLVGNSEKKRNRLVPLYWVWWQCWNIINRYIM